MDRINELLAKLAECTDDELTELLTLCQEEFARLDDEAHTPDNVAQMKDLVAAAKSAKEQISLREQAQAEAEQAAEAMRAEMHSVNGGDDDAESTDEADAGGEGADAESVDAEADAEAQPEAVAASTRPGGRAARMANGRGPARPSPEAGRGNAPRHALVAASGTGAFSGQPLDTIDALGEAMAERLRTVTPAAGKVLIASARWSYPAERQLGDDAAENTRKIRAVTDGDALVATGGICAPVNIDYDVPVWSVADRPLKDALPAFEATRGGITFVTPPDIGGLAGATAIWTAATDASPGGSTKPVLQVACGSTVTVDVNAIPTRLEFGNMQSRFAPEQIAANTELALAAAARIAEVELLTLIMAQCKLISAAQYLGATRDILATADKIIAAYKDTHRLSDEQMLTAIFPRWAKAMFRADMAREIAHDNAGSVNVLAITDEQIEAWFAVRSVRVVWTLDNLPAQGSGAITYPTQVLAAEVTETAEVSWPTKLVWQLFVEGTFQFLDGGRLDLGVVRDATLDSTNDYETFVEPFESIAFRGVEALAIVSTVQPNGGSAGTLAESTYTAGL